jgi:hypothetical protein
MPRAPVGHQAFGPAAERAHAMRDDRAAARRAARQARERVLGSRDWSRIPSSGRKRDPVSPPAAEVEGDITFHYVNIVTDRIAPSDESRQAARSPDLA